MTADGTSPQARDSEENPMDTNGNGSGSGSGSGHGPGSGSGSGPAPATDRPAPAVTTPGGRPVSTTLRVGTVVWGLVLAAVGVLLLAVAAGAALDVELALIGLVGLAGVGLLVGAVVTTRRRGQD